MIAHKRIAAVLALWVGLLTTAYAQDPVIDFANGDPDMAAAQEKARATLPTFWKVFEHPGPGEEGFSLKVAFPTRGSNTEYTWMLDIERKDGKITGVAGNIPVDATWMHQGERVEIREDRISDWMFMRTGKMVGNETMRPMLKRMPPEETAQYRAMMEQP